MHISRLGAQLPGGIVTSPLQLGRLSQISQIADELSEGHAVSDRAKELSGRPGVVRDALAAQVVQQNQQIQVLKMAKHTVNDGVNLWHLTRPGRRKRLWLLSIV